MFSPTRDGKGGARILRLAGVKVTTAISLLQETLGGRDLTELRKIESATCSRPWLLVLDGADSLLVDASSESTEELASKELWDLLGSALSTSSHLRIILTSHRPRYDAPLPCKVVAYEVPPLAREDAALLLAKRAHRPLYAQDFALTSEGGNDGQGRSIERGEPLNLMGRRREFLQQLAGHPLLAALGGAPADILAAAAEVTPQLPTLLSHSKLRTCKIGCTEDDGGRSVQRVRTDNDET